jgi:hypothetical protein
MITLLFTHSGWVVLRVFSGRFPIVDERLPAHPEDFYKGRVVYRHVEGTTLVFFLKPNRLAVLNLAQPMTFVPVDITQPSLNLTADI